MILLFRSPAQVTKRAKQKLVIFFPYFLLLFLLPPILRRPFCWTEEGSFWCCHLASAAGRESDPHLSLLTPLGSIERTEPKSLLFLLLLLLFERRAAGVMVTKKPWERRGGAEGGDNSQSKHGALDRSSFSFRTASNWGFRAKNDAYFSVKLLSKPLISTFPLSEN